MELRQWSVMRSLNWLIVLVSSYRLITPRIDLKVVINWEPVNREKGDLKIFMKIRVVALEITNTVVIRKIQ